MMKISDKAWDRFERIATISAVVAAVIAVVLTIVVTRGI